jgi:hypothetical protein
MKFDQDDRLEARDVLTSRENDLLNAYGHPRSSVIRKPDARKGASSLVASVRSYLLLHCGNKAVDTHLRALSRPTTADLKGDAR